LPSFGAMPAFTVTDGVDAPRQHLCTRMAVLCVGSQSIVGNELAGESLPANSTRPGIPPIGGGIIQRQIMFSRWFLQPLGSRRYRFLCWPQNYTPWVLS
jgi:hypothetical protein